MPSKKDIEGWFKSLEETVEMLRITSSDKFIGEVILKFERSNDSEIYILFESGKWARLNIHENGWGEQEINLHSELSIYYDKSDLYRLGVITKYIFDTANSYHEELNRLEFEERDRKEYARLQAKYG